MAQNLDELSLALNQGQAAKSNLAGLDEQYARASALRDQPMQGPDKYGQLSPLMAIADVMRQSQGRRQMRELAPQRTQARSDVANAASALPMYNAKVAADKVSQDQANFDTTTGLTKAKHRYQQEEDARKAKAVSSAMGTPEAWVMPDGSGLITGYPTKGGGLVDGNGQPLDTTGRVPYKEYSISTRQIKKGKKDGEPLDKVGSPDLVAQILESPDLESATGTFDPERWAGKFGLDASDIPGLDTGDSTAGERIQALQSKMSDVGIDSVKTNLQGLGINPTDKDLEVAFASIPDAGTQPLAWAIWTRDQYLPMLKKAGGKGVMDGSADRDEVVQYIEKVEASVAGALEKYGDAPTPVATGPYEDPAEEEAYQAWLKEQKRQKR